MSKNVNSDNIRTNIVVIVIVIAIFFGILLLHQAGVKRELKEVKKILIEQKEEKDLKKSRIETVFHNGVEKIEEKWFSYTPKLRCDAIISLQNLFLKLQFEMDFDDYFAFSRKFKRLWERHKLYQNKPNEIVRVLVKRGNEIYQRSPKGTKTSEGKLYGRPVNVVYSKEAAEEMIGILTELLELYEFYKYQEKLFTEENLVAICKWTKTVNGEYEKGISASSDQIKQLSKAGKKFKNVLLQEYLWSIIQEKDLEKLKKVKQILDKKLKNASSEEEKKAVFEIYMYLFYKSDKFPSSFLDFFLKNMSKIANIIKSRDLYTSYWTALEGYQNSSRKK